MHIDIEDSIIVSIKPIIDKVKDWEFLFFST